LTAGRQDSDDAAQAYTGDTGGFGFERQLYREGISRSIIIDIAAIA
jgi:hypothetical protein